MLSEHIKKIYLEGDYNCAESILLAANEEYDLNIPKDSYKLLSPFGGGMGCGKACGAVCGALAVLGYMNVDGRAHATEGFKDLCANFVAKVEQECKCIDCSVIKPQFFVEGQRCLGAVIRIGELLEEYIKEIK